MNTTDALLAYCLERLRSGDTDGAKRLAKAGDNISQGVATRDVLQFTGAESLALTEAALDAERRRDALHRRAMASLERQLA